MYLALAATFALCLAPAGQALADLSGRVTDSSTDDPVAANHPCKSSNDLGYLLGIVVLFVILAWWIG